MTWRYAVDLPLASSLTLDEVRQAADLMRAQATVEIDYEGGNLRLTIDAPDQWAIRERLDEITFATDWEIPLDRSNLSSLVP